MTPATEPQLSRRIVLAGTVGNILEWYDFSIYGYFAHAIGREFFPTEDPLTSILAAFGAFAVGFLMRPFGAVFFGHVGDRIGRKRALELAVICMAVPTFLMGLLPGYAVLGPTAAVLLVLLRMLQGLSVGGEATTAQIFLIEHAPKRQQGLAGSWSGAGITAGILLGSAVGALSVWLAGEDSPLGLGWRVPMLLGLLAGLVGLYVRQHLPEEPKAQTAPDRVPVLEAFRRHSSTIGLIFGMTLLGGIGFYLSFVYLVTYLEEFIGISSQTALTINTISMGVLLMMNLLGGWLSDRINVKALLLAVAAATVVLAWPLFWLLQQPEPLLILSAQVVLAILLGLFFGGSAKLMYAQLPADLRCTVLSVGFNLSVGLIGGLTPVVATLLIEQTHNVMAPAWYLAAAAGVSLIALLWTRRPEQVAETPVHDTCATAMRSGVRSVALRLSATRSGVRPALADSTLRHG